MYRISLRTFFFLYGISAQFIIFTEKKLTGFHFSMPIEVMQEVMQHVLNLLTVVFVKKVKRKIHRPIILVLFISFLCLDRFNFITL